MILVATTLAAFVMDQEDTWSAWLRNAEEIQASHPDGVTYFAAIETDARGLDPFAPLLTRLAEVGGEHWTFSLDDGRTEVTTANRLRHITTGQNLASDRACTSPDCTHLLFLAADLEPPADCLPKLLELDHPLVGGHCGTYGLTGPPRGGYPAAWDVRVHMATAAFVMLHRSVFNRIRWRWDLDAGMSDDPCLHHDAETLLGIPTLVRHDVVGVHWPQCIPGIEDRGHDMAVVRTVPGGAADPAWVDHHAEARS